jgi:hypothetical protein
MKRIIITLLALLTFGGVASADRGHRGPVVRDHRTWNAPARTYAPSRTYTRPSYTYNRPSYSYSRPSVRVYSQPRYTRHAVYVRRPVIAYRYTNYYSRPTVIAENYPTMEGYYWVAGQWQWNGYEWIWQAGHYEPDPNYSGDYYYQGTYDNGQYYYDSSYSQPTISGGIYFNSGY